MGETLGLVKPRLARKLQSLVYNNLHRHNGQVDSKDPGDRVLQDGVAMA